MFGMMLGLGHGKGKFKGALHGLPVAYWSLTYKNVEEMWERLKMLYAPLTTHKNETMKQLHLETGGHFECWSTEKVSSARGRAYAGIIVDESGWTPNLMRVWTDDLQAMLVDFEGWAVFGGTPNGINDYHTMYQWGQDSNNPLWASWQFNSMENPYLSRDYLEQIRTSVPSRTWQQEYLGEFLPDGGAVFRNIKACTMDEMPTEAQGRVIMGVDLGRVNDFTVIFAMDSATNKILEFDRFTDTVWEIQAARLERMAEKWKPSLIIIEENFNDMFSESLMQKGLPIRQFHTGKQSKQQIINELAIAFERELIRIPNDATLLGELQAFTVERLPSGTLRYGAPKGLHDDYVMALAFTWHGVINQPSFTFHWID